MPHGGGRRGYFDTKGSICKDPEERKQGLVWCNESSGVQEERGWGEEAREVSKCPVVPPSGGSPWRWGSVTCREDDVTTSQQGSFIHCSFTEQERGSLWGLWEGALPGPSFCVISLGSHE